MLEKDFLRSVLRKECLSAIRQLKTEIERMEDLVQALPEDGSVDEDSAERLDNQARRETDAYVWYLDLKHDLLDQLMQHWRMRR
jgi:hypothetical protein